MMRTLTPPSVASPRVFRTLSVALVPALVMCLGVETAAADVKARQGMYAGVELGFANAADVESTVSGVNHPTRCDQLLGTRNTADAFVRDTDVVDLSDPACNVGGPRPLSRNAFDLDTGFLGAVSLGYAWRNLRVEFEYLHRSHGGDQQPFRTAAGNAALQSKGAEWSELDPPSERVSEFQAHQLFANAYYDFLNASRWTPYVGAGVGWARTSLRYDNRFVRKTLAQGYQRDATTDADISPERPAAAAGTLSFLDTEVADWLFGFQFMGGLDYALTDKVSIGMKGRWASFEDLENSAVWNLIRSHEPVQADGTTPFRTRQEFGNLSYWAFSFGLKYHF